MSPDQQNTTESPQNPAPNGPEGQEGSEPDPRNAEAAGWRKKLRAAEAELEQTRAERDALQQQIDQGRTDRVHEALREALQGLPDEGIETVLSAADTDRFLTDEGEIDADRVAQYTRPFTVSLPPGPRNKRAWQTGPKATSGPSSSPGADWGSVIRNE